MKSFKLTLEPSENRKTVNVNLEDLFFTEEEWNEMNHEEQMLELQKYAQELEEQPYWYVGKVEDLT